MNKEMKSFAPSAHSLLCDWGVILGRGIGQVMFQNHALSGFLMWVGICI